MTDKTILPNSTIGVFGSGQLGRMFAIEARKMGYRVATFSPDSDTPTGQVADIEIIGDYLDLDAVAKFAKSVSVLTFEFENVPSKCIETATEFVAVYPRGEALYITQNRLREKIFLQKYGYPITPFKHIKCLSDFDGITFPSVLKTAGFGYDGKGQSKLQSAADIEIAFQNLHGQEAILEEFIDFQKEISVVCARDHRGNFVHYGAIENVHLNHILDISFAPAIVEKKIFAEAIEIAQSITEKFDYVGTMCVEFFVTKSGKLLVNEIAPRPHNSGHLTIDACITNQFEQQVRAVCGLPLGSTEFLKPAAMVNLLGDLWQTGEPSWQNGVQNPNVKLHLYGKSEARKGRKMGHLTALAFNAPDAAVIVKNAAAALKQ